MRTNAKIIYKYLDYKGWSKNIICAAIANMQAESALSPGRIEMTDDDGDGDLAYGLVQWDPPANWTGYASQHGYAIDDIHRQLDYLVYSMRRGAGHWNVGGVTEEYQKYAHEFLESTDEAGKLAIVFLLCYVRPKISDTSARNLRASYANEWLAYFNQLGW